MPALSAWAVRTAFVHLVAGSLLGSALLAAKAGFLALDWPTLRTIHIEVLAFGWTANLAMGVAFWILPKRGGVGETQRRLAAVALGLLNAGIIVVLIASAGDLQSLFVPARALQLLGGLLFAGHAAARVGAAGRI